MTNIKAVRKKQKIRAESTHKAYMIPTCIRVDWNLVRGECFSVLNLRKKNEYMFCFHGIHTTHERRRKKNAIFTSFIIFQYDLHSTKIYYNKMKIWEIKRMQIKPHIIKERIEWLYMLTHQLKSNFGFWFGIIDCSTKPL